MTTDQRWATLDKAWDWCFKTWLVWLGGVVLSAITMSLSPILGGVILAGAFGFLIVGIVQMARYGRRATKGL